MTPKPGTFTVSAFADLIGYVHPAALLKGGRILVMGDGGAALYDPASGEFKRTGPPLESDAGFFVPNVVVALPDGRALAYGAWIVELYDPSTGAFSRVGAQPGGHGADSAVMLADGRVLSAGGDDDAGPSGRADIFDPATGRFSVVGSLRTPRHNEMAVLLPDGRVLVVGGDDETQNDGHVFSSAELYDPNRGKWSSGGHMTVARTGATATLLGDGRVLIVGGYNYGADGQSNGTTLASAELYDPVSGTFTPTGSMKTPRSSHLAARLPDGRILIVGGEDDTAYWPTMEIYDPKRGTFSDAGRAEVNGSLESAIPLPDGRIFFLRPSASATYVAVCLYWP